MKTKYILILVICCNVSYISAQLSSNLNNYKYIIVPDKYDFFKEPNKYRLNELTVFLFQKKGFNVLSIADPYPADLADNNCLALRANVTKESSLLRTRLKVELNDCKGHKVYETKIGKTIERNVYKSYNLALRDAFTSFDVVNYNYNGKTLAPVKTNVTDTNATPNISKTTASTQDEIKKLKAQVATLKQEKEKQAEELKKDQPSKVSLNFERTVLYAQKIENGFQLVDKTPQVVMILLETARRDTFIVKGENATVYKDNDVWYLSKNENDKVVTTQLTIKF